MLVAGVAVVVLLVAFPDDLVQSLRVKKGNLLNSYPVSAYPDKNNF